MAIWSGGTTINSNATAMVFNQLFNRKTISMARKKNGLLYAVLGKSENGSTPMDGVGFANEQKVTGNKVEVRLHGKIRTINTVSDGANEIATASLSHDSAVFGGAEFDLTHYADVYPIPRSEMDRFAGDELKSLSFIDEVMNHLSISVEDALGTGINSTNAQARTTLGGWQNAIADDNTYGGIDRTDSTNADFRGNVTGSTGTLTLAKIRTAQNTAIAAGGNPRVGVAGTTVYGTVQQLVEAYTQADYDEAWSEFGGQYVMYGGIRFILDQRCSSGVLGLLDPDTFKLYRRDMNFTQSGIVLDPSRTASYVLPFGLWVAFLCSRPSSSSKLTGIS